MKSSDNDNDNDKVKSRLASLCARSETCTYEIQVKLKRTKLSEADKADILEFLVRNDFVNDERYAIAYAHDKVEFALYGPVKIRHELRKRRIPLPIVEKAIKSVPEERYVEKAVKLAAAKVKALSCKELDSEVIHDKIYQYLVARGYSYAQIHAALPSRSAFYDEIDT